MGKKSIAYIALGSNLGDRSQNIARAITLIQENVGTLLKQSSFIRTEAEGFNSDELFFNGVIKLETRLSPQELLHQLKTIEKQMGRVYTQAQGYENRIIDLDIIFYDEIILDVEGLEIPHSRFRERRFVLEPLCEIAPDYRDPVSKRTVSDLMKELVAKTDSIE